MLIGCISSNHSLVVPILLPDTGRGLGTEQHMDQATAREGCGWSSHWLFAGFVNELKQLQKEERKEKKDPQNRTNTKRFFCIRF